MTELNQNVSKLVEDINHPLKSEIQVLRNIILNVDSEIAENIKWNSPNYTFRNEDRITMRLQPKNQIQLIFHRGAKKLAQPSERLIDDQSKILNFKENNRAIANFNSMEDINDKRPFLIDIIKSWISTSN